MKRVSLVLAVCLFCGTGSVAATEIAGKVAGIDVERAAPTTRVVDQPNALLNALKRNDFAAFLEAIERDKDIAAIAKQWDEQVERQREYQAKRAAEAKSPTEQAMESLLEDEFQQQWQKLQTTEGIDALADELQPKIAQAVSEHLLQFNLGFGAALTALASEKDLSAHEVQQLTQLMYAVQNWTGRVDFADRQRLKRALNAVSVLVRQTKLKRFEDTQLLAFEDAIVHGDAMIATVKQVFGAYDVDVDQILNSVRFTEVDAFADKATLHSEARVFGVDLSHDFKMQYVRGEWLPTEHAEMARKHQQRLDAESEREAAEQAAEAAAQAAKAASTPVPRKSGSGGCSSNATFDVEVPPDMGKSKSKSK